MKLTTKPPVQPELAGNANHPLAICMEATVPLLILEMEKRGGPDDYDREWCRKQADIIGQYGDILQHRGRSKDESGKWITGGDVAKRLIRALAIMAFVPGGVTFCGTNYQGGGTDECPAEEARAYISPTTTEATK